MTERDCMRLSPKGRRRARIVRAIEGAIYAVLMAGIGYGLCAIVYGLQCLLGVAN